MVKEKTVGSGSCRVCSSAQRTAKNLRFVSQILRRELLVEEEFIATGSESCESLQSRWKEWTAQRCAKVRGEDRFVLQNAIKGTKTLFDEPCSNKDPKRNCDVIAGHKAVESWCAKALDRGTHSPGKPGRTDPAVLLDIKRRTKKIMGTGWFQERRGEKVYVPDQQGCYEMERGMGGTLSVPVWDPDLDHEKKASHVYGSLGIHGDRRAGYNAALEDCCQVSEDSDRVAYCRVGKAKQKGKLRVVTMQTSVVKDVLRPVHESAYNRLSRRPWLVRGNVEKGHFESLRPGLSPGFDFISGDYEASTDNLHTDAVLAVVEALADDLPPRERDLFVRSFRDCHVTMRSKSGVLEDFRVVRGSMMGNLGSFVVLCLLNRICYERALNLSGYSPRHPVLINGDDILFPGELGLYSSWLHCTSEVGFVINKDKTMRSRKFGDLNSQTYNYGRSRKVKKLCFGFLGSDSWKQPVGSLTTPLFELCRQVSFATAAWLLFSFPVRRLLSRVPSSLPAIPRRWFGFLVKRSWFRALLDSPEPEIESVGVSRSLPFSLGPPLAETTPFIEARIKAMGDRLIRDHVNECKGVPVQPREQKIPHRRAEKLRSKFRISRATGPWRRLWLTPVLDYMTCHFPHLLMGGNQVWVDDQPGLQSTYEIVRSPIRFPLSFSPRLDEFIPTLCPDGSTIFCAC
ncbi:RNA-dependent RNA polymerase [Erysiphe necator associated ourmia-like virus 120]|nr:RNA-dependent RNA polymerase [Erysiphe necator associated ourmia-like virus 120]